MSLAKPGAGRPPLVAHILHRLAVGGLENGLVNLINYMPAERYRHAIICLTDASDFRWRIQRRDVPVIALHKREGKDVAAYWRVWRALRQLRPDIVHTRNLPALGVYWPRGSGRHSWTHSRRTRPRHVRSRWVESQI